MKSLNRVGALLVAVVLGTEGAAVGLDGQFVDVRPIPGPPKGPEGVNSLSGEWSPSVTEDGLILVFASSRDSIEGQVPLWTLYMASRDSTGRPFGPPRRLDEIHTNPRFVSGFDFFFGPQVTPDGLEIYFTHDADLYVGRRASRSEPFGIVEELTDLNSGEFEGGIALAPDADTIVFHRSRANEAGGRDL